MSVSTSPSSLNPFATAAELLDPPPWEPEDRAPLEPHQRPPAGDWSLWLLEAGRGAGKTEACARYFAGFMRAHPGARGRIIAPTYGDAVQACVRGPSGLLSIDPEIRWLPSDPGGSKVAWPNGSEALVLGTPYPNDIERLRATGNRHLDWWEEMAANPQLGGPGSEGIGGAWDQAQLGLRMGRRPHSIASTTPRGTPAYVAVRALAGVALTHATLFDNPHNPDWWVALMRERYEGTRLGRQELGGELIEDVEGALWDRALLERCRVDEHPELARVVVAIDPAAKSTASSDDTGIVVAGLGVDGHGYVLADRTCHLPPDGWGQRAVAAYREFRADRIVAEVNNGGEMVTHVIHVIDDTVATKTVHASRGKQVRAEPIAALYGGGAEDGQEAREPKVHHVGGFAELEDQQCLWVPEDGDSPDRLDALVWALTELMLGKRPPRDLGPVSVSGRSSWRG